jgi:formylglycine-generating enzyme
MTGKLFLIFMACFFIFNCEVFKLQEEIVFYPVSSNLVTVPAITGFSMGDGTSTITDAVPVHTVASITSFKICKYETTYGQWYDVYQWAISNGYKFANAGREGADSSKSSGAEPTGKKNLPVTSISWRDAIVWCNAISLKEGLTPCYTYSGSTIKDATNATACDAAVLTLANNGYRLPTEAEWEAAARYIDGTSWTTGTYASGASDATESATGLVAWYNTSPEVAGTKKANALGAYDMSGNVLEFCWDWAGTYIDDSDTSNVEFNNCNGTDPAGLSSGTYKVVRSTSCKSNAASQMVCSRDIANFTTSAVALDTGFRVVRR